VNNAANIRAFKKPAVLIFFTTIYDNGTARIPTGIRKMRITTASENT
jgi:hypothetical protein